jgi:hypothetical protein
MMRSIKFTRQQRKNIIPQSRRVYADFFASKPKASQFFQLHWSNGRNTLRCERYGEESSKM